MVAMILPILTVLCLMGLNVASGMSEVKSQDRGIEKKSECPWSQFGSRFNSLETDLQALTHKVDALTEKMDAQTQKVDVLANKMDAQTGKMDKASNGKVCPSGFEYLPEAGACYKVIFQSLDWYGSSQVCKSVMPGVHLAAITSAEKQRAIEKYLNKEFRKPESSACLKTLWPNGGKSVWLSGQTKDPNRCGTPYYWKTLNAIEIPFSYSNWLAGEPNCSYGAEKCAHIAAGRGYVWNDSPCSLLSCALCEF